MAERTGERTWRIRGATLELPVAFPRARFAVAAFRADRAAVDAVLAGTPLRAASLGGRAVSVLLCVHYDEWALGAYDEVGVGVLARGASDRWPRPPALDRTGLYLCDLPVSGSFTQEAGRDVWGLPKWVMESELGFSARSTRVSVVDQGRPVLSGRLAHGGVPLPFPVRGALPTWAYLDRGAQACTLLRGLLRGQAWGARIGRGSVALQLGDHPMADRMRTLGMTGQPWITVSGARLRGSLDASHAVAPARPRW